MILKVYSDITDTELDIFDYYEDSGYDKRTVEVVLIVSLCNFHVIFLH